MKRKKTAVSTDRIQFARALEYENNGDFYAAEMCYLETIKVNPAHFDALYLMAVIRSDESKFSEALNYLKQALNANERSFLAWALAGSIHKKIGSLNEAKDCFRSVIEIAPSSPAYNDLGSIYYELGDIEGAVKLFELALVKDVNNADAHNNMGLVLTRLCEYERAIHEFEIAVTLQPHFAMAYNNRGLLWRARARFDLALQDFDRALQLAPNLDGVKLNKAILLLLLGNYEEGLPLYEFRFDNQQQRTMRSYNRPFWQGGDAQPEMKLFVFHEQGLGDTIQFVRFVSDVANYFGKVYLQVQDSLTGIFFDLPNNVELLPSGKTPPDFDFCCPLLSLPYALRIGLDNLDATSNYLSAFAIKIQSCREFVHESGKPKIGIVWRGNPAHKNDHNRSISLNIFKEILVEGVDYYCLHNDLTDFELEMLANLSNVKNLGENLLDFANTTAFCELMDMIISVDTSVAHLSAAMGKPTWILLPFIPDWRWMLDRNDSPWYQSVRLFRQGKDGSWEQVVRHVYHEQIKLMSSPGTLRIDR